LAALIKEKQTRKIRLDIQERIHGKPDAHKEVKCSIGSLKEP
jgi:hypothetical protein